MAKPIEMYVTYHPWETSVGERERFARINVKDLKFLVKKAALYIHPPDFGTGVVVINQEKTRWQPTPEEKKEWRAQEREAIRKIKAERAKEVL